jgi:hypothetical protein
MQGNSYDGLPKHPRRDSAVSTDASDARVGATNPQNESKGIFESGRALQFLA